MIDLDEILQKKLSDLERGVPLEEVLADLPPEAGSLVPLLKLASESSMLAHPQMSPNAVRLQQARLMAATVMAKLSRWAAGLPKLPAWVTETKAVYALGSVTILAVFVILGVSLFALSQGPTHTAHLVSPNGIVEVSSPSGDWHFLQEGEAINKGQSVRTYADSSVSLVFSDGSRTVIGPDAEVTLSDMGGDKGASIQVKLIQNSGSTTNDVIPLRGSGSYFQVDTPGGLATVHGTSFDVAINSAGQTLFGVTHGLVQVQNDRAEVFLASGQATIVQAGEDPEKPGYQFTLQGKIDSIVGDEWTVNGVKFNAAGADIADTFKEGDMVLVKGRILEGVWVADSIDWPNNDKTRLRFTGVVQAIPDNKLGTWKISGFDVLVNEKTELEGDIKVDSPVEVNFVVLPNNGGWLATSIELLEDDEEEPEGKPTQTKTATPTGTITPATETPTPTVTMTPTETMTPTVTVTGTLSTATAQPKNDTQRCLNRTQQQPAALKLVQKFKPFIPTITYEEVIGWFCKGFGFGEIDLAYDLSLKSGMPVYDIFKMRTDGMGWGNIKKKIMALMMSTGTPMAPGKGKGPKK